MVDYSKFKKSLKNLELQYDNYRFSFDRDELTELDREALAESVIQRFETCYDVLWKHLKRYLVEELGLADVPNSPKPVFRLAGENFLLPGPVKHWIEYASVRIGTAHDYSGEKAARCLDVVPRFIEEATELFQTLTGEEW